ncbi:MAG: leucine-rich repeat domain-containing protein [Rikenellaceae bacterium]|nr:leucine-rich repeat domain-containing protein [Rikenellaceae bacterium]
MKRAYIFLIIAFGLLGGCNTPVIQFQDNATKQICVANWDTNNDGEIQLTEASRVSKLGKVFQATDITYFEELQYFTNLDEIGMEDFKDCSKLKNITIPNRVSKIGQRAFYGCTCLQSINIPINVQTIEEKAFCYCTGTLTVDSKVVETDHQRETSPFYGTHFTTIHIGNQISQIGDYAFANCTRATNISLPNSITSIGWSAFADCWSLKSIAIPENVRNIESWTFSNCSSLESVTIPNNIKRIGDNTFEGCSSLANVTIPNSIETIGWRAFKNCSKLTTVVLGNNISNIGDEAFCGCIKLSNITMPQNIRWFGEDIFKGCIALPVDKDVRYADTYVVEAINKNKESYEIKEGSRIIGDQAFMNCKKLKNISLPKSVTIIGNKAFKCCSNLKHTLIHEKVSSIGIDAFYECTGELVINSKLVESDHELREVRDGSYFCYYKSSNYWLDSANFSKITIGDNIQKLGNNIFYGQRELKAIIFPEGILSIGKGALDNCNKLTYIYCKAEFPPMTDNLNLEMSCVIHVPKQSVADYKSIPQWGKYTIVACEH